MHMYVLLHYFESRVRVFSLFDLDSLTLETSLGAPKRNQQLPQNDHPLLRQAPKYYIPNLIRNMLFFFAVFIIQLIYIKYNTTE